MEHTKNAHPWIGPKTLISIVQKTWHKKNKDQSHNTKT